MKEIFKSLFGASSKEITGFSALIIVLIISLLAPRVINRLTAKEDSHWIEDEKMLDSLVNLLENERESDPIISKVRLEPHYFNPNEVSTLELQALGFAEKIAHRIINYRKKGGSFKIKDDLYKIYDIDSALVEELYNFIELPEKLPRFEIENKPVAKATGKPKLASNVYPVDLPDFDVNTADTATLQTIKGIGSVLSRRIIDFREKLGGFIENDQLYEVYNLDTVVVLRLMMKIYIDDNFIPEKLFINRASEEELAGHPYITWQQARLIIAYRNQHGDYHSGQDLLKVYAVNENDVHKMVSYLDWIPSN